MSVDPEVLRLARQSIDTAPGYAEPSKELLLAIGLTLVAEMVDENLLFARELVRLAEATPASPSPT